MSETLNELLDETIDDLADLPETKPFPNGAHNINVKVKRAVDDKKQPKPGVYIIECTYNELAELSDPDTPEEQLAKPGDQCAVWIYTRKKDGTPNEFGQGQLKVILKPIATALQVSTVGQVIEATEKNGIECIAVTKIRKSKDAQYSDSMQIDKLEVL